MATPIQLYYEKRGRQLVKNLISRHFDAYYCANKEEALAKALELIPEGSSVGWGGCMSAVEIGLLDAVRNGNYVALDRENAQTQEDRDRLAMECLRSDVFITGANAMSMDGEMVSIDGNGNRVAAIIFGPKNVLVLVGMNKVCDTLEDAISRARTVAAPINKQRFQNETPCGVTGTCADCKSVGCICNHIVVTRHCRPVGRIRYLVVGEDLGF